MSSDRTCRLSELRAAESRLKDEIAVAEAAARRAESNIKAIEADMKKTKDKVKNLASDVSQVSATVSRQQRQIASLDGAVDALQNDVSDLSTGLASQRQHIYQIDGEIAVMQAQQQADLRRIQQNERFIASMQQDIAALDQNVEANRQAIAQAQHYMAVLNQEIHLAQQRIDANDRYIQQLENGVQQINTYLEDERKRQERDRLSQLNDVQAQQHMAALLRDSLDVARVRRFGAESPYHTALTTLEHAEESTRLGRLEAARATYQEAQRQFSQVARDVDTREREYQRYRSRCEASLEQLGLAIQQAGSQEMLAWHKEDYQALQTRYNDLRYRFQNAEFDQAGRPEQVIAVLENMTMTIARLQDDVLALENRLVETIQKARTRLERMQQILGALMHIWGDNDFDISYGYVEKDDPKSALKVQTIRPNRPNVTLNMDLDGTFQFSWTGYAGMECAKDIEQFEETLREQYHLEMAVSSAQDKPGQPNPDLGPSGPGNVIKMQKPVTKVKDKTANR